MLIQAGTVHVHTCTCTESLLVLMLVLSPISHKNRGVQNVQYSTVQYSMQFVNCLHCCCLQAYTSQFVALVMFGLVMSEDRVSLQGRRKEIIDGLSRLSGETTGCLSRGGKKDGLLVRDKLSTFCFILMPLNTTSLHFSCNSHAFVIAFNEPFKCTTTFMCACVTVII